MNSKDFLKEGFVEDATDVHMDHEVQMAREECYHAAEHALAIHKLLRNISEQQGLEGWVSSKITLANDYLNTVREHLEYELLQPQIDDVAIGMPIAENEQQGVAEGDFDKWGSEVKTPTGKKQRYEMMQQNGKIKKFFAANDKEAKSIAKDYNAKSLIKLKGDVPGKKLKEQGISDEELRQRFTPKFQATDAQINDPEWMRSRGLIPVQDIERDYKDTLEKENYTDAVARAASQGLPVFQHKGKTYATKNPDYNKYYTDKDPGHSKGGQPLALNKQQTQQLAGTNIQTSSGAPVIAGSKMMKETTAGSVAGVVNPKSNKPKNQIGSLFGGSYKQSRKKQ